MKRLEPKYKVNDSVRLNTGGPVMSVQENIMKRTLDMLDKNRPEWEFMGEVKCTWFDGDKNAYGVFHQDTLINVTKI